MKMKSIFALLLMMLAFTACNDDETVSGVMKYNKGYQQTAFFSASISTGSDCEALLAAVKKGINGQILNYNKEWDVPFSGSSTDSALKKADQEAVADFDAAVEGMLAWKKQFDEFKVSKDFGKGSFSMTYVVRVWRDKVLRESDPIVFEYTYKK